MRASEKDVDYLRELAKRSKRKLSCQFRIAIEEWIEMNKAANGEDDDEQSI